MNSSDSSQSSGTFFKYSNKHQLDADTSFASNSGMTMRNSDLFRDSTLLDRQSLISILSMDDERCSLLSDDYLLECWQLESAKLRSTPHDNEARDQIVKNHRGDASTNIMSSSTTFTTTSSGGEVPSSLSVDSSSGNNITKLSSSGGSRRDHTQSTSTSSGHTYVRRGSSNSPPVDHPMNSKSETSHDSDNSPVGGTSSGGTSTVDLLSVSASSTSSSTTEAGDLKHLGPPEWLHDDSVLSCNGCSSEFGILNRKHVSISHSVWVCMLYMTCIDLPISIIPYVALS